MSDPVIIVEQEPSATIIVDQRGTDGKDGFTILSGPGVPDPSLGVDGDFYIRTSPMSIYGPKTDGDWGASTPLGGQVISGTITVANAVWSMTHNLDMASAAEFNPAVWWFQDESGNPMEPADLYYLTNNIAVAVWLTPVRGTWRLS